MKKILAITGIRSEYDILYPVINEIRKRDNWQVKLVVCGAHLSDWHGFTLKNIEKDGFEIADKIDYLLMTNRKTQRVKGVGILTYALSQTVERENPDFLLVVGDREESIATALVGNYMDILVAHIGGGDPVYGNADDPIRHAVSKLSHIHFVTNEKYKEFLIKMGEEKWRIFNVGNPALENIKNEPAMTKKELGNYLNLDIETKDYIVLIKHPLSSEKEEAYSQMKTILESLEEVCKESNLIAICIYPNTDPGSYDILKAINEFEKSKYICFYKTLPRKVFINLMRYAKCLVGNSSMGILEAPFYELPVINVGNRQKGRVNAGNVVFINYDKVKIKTEILKACFDETYRKQLKKIKYFYGDGNTSSKIVDILNNIYKDNKKKWLVKKLSYL